MRKASRAIVVKDNKLLVMHRNKFGHEYYALIGGNIDIGESPEQALYREVQEESSLQISNHRLVIIEDAGDMYGLQYIYLCDYMSGEPALKAEAIESKINADGKNLYTPMWLPFESLPKVNFVPQELQQVLISGLNNGFSVEPIMLTVRA